MKTSIYSILKKPIPCPNKERTFIVKHLVKIIPLLFTVIPCLAQSPISLPVTILDSNAGIVNNGNYFCYKDSRDLLWISSYSGLQCFDGKKNRQFLPDLEDSTSIKGKEVVSFFEEDKKGNIWFGTDRALNCFIRKENRFGHFNFTDNDEGEYKVQGIDGSGKIWFTFDGFIYTFDPSTSRFTSQARIDLNQLRGEVVFMSEFQLNDKREVIRTFSYGSYLDDPGLEVHEFGNGELTGEYIVFNESVDHPLRIRDVYSYRDSLLYIAALGGFYEFNLHSRSLNKLLMAGKTEKDGFTGIVPFSDSTLFLARTSAEYVEYHPVRKEIMEQYTLNDGETEVKDAPRTLSVDKDDGIYIHLVGRGLAFFHPRNLLFKHRIYTTNSDDNPVLISFGGGMAELNDGRVFAASNYNEAFLFSGSGKLLETFNTSSPLGKRLPSNLINSLLKDSKGRIWLFHYSRYISRIDDPEMIQINSFEVNNMIWGGRELPSGQLIFNPRKGLLTCHVEDEGPPKFEKLEGADFTKHYATFDTHPSGLFYTGEFKRSLMALDPAQNFKVVNEIPFDLFLNDYQLVEETGDFLLGTENGLYYFDIAANTIRFIDYCACGPNVNVYCVIPIGNNVYLMTTDMGICTIALKHKTSVRYGLEHGLGQINFNRDAAFMHSNGKLWLGNSSGITFCDPDHLGKPVFDNQVNISNILVNDDTAFHPGLSQDSVLNVEEIDTLNLHHTANTISFEFAAFSYAGINAHAYEYRMSGLEKHWVEGSNRGFARYANLPSGDYVFEARVKGQPQSVRKVRIKVYPRLLERLWFQLLLGISGFLLLYITVRWNIRRRQHLQQLRFERRLALEQERVRIATDMHDEVGSALSTLNMRTQMLAERAGESKLKSQLDQLASSSHQLTQKIREIIWTINAQNDTLENLVTKLHQYALEFYEETYIHCTFDLSGEPNTSSIPGNHRQEIYLAFKEALHNIFKHARADQVHITMETENQTLLIKIRDNGIGFDPINPNPAGQGLRSMKKRLERINGHFEITSGSGGTTITFHYAVAKSA